MSLIGNTLGHYTISTLIGRGGMGEVYKAKDQKLGRDVAIKVLPEEFAKDADRVSRFQREAKLLASLNHPNIAAIHGLEESEGTHFLVLELIEGDTLADRLKQGAIPVEEALKFALQIAEALEAAHEKGVIHRDLKPSNIRVTPEGKVKVLDFGLAKAFAGEKEDMILSDSPTISTAATQKGVILGTAAYMSPEQARGMSVDKRADIWAFGCVLFEMLTGHVAFRGEDVSEILASVIKGDVRLDLLPANLHPRVREVITRCLQRDLRRRYSGITDARYEIEQALADPSGVLVQPVGAVEPRRKLRTILPWAAATLVLGLIIVGVTVWNLRTPEPRRVIRLDYVLPEDQQFNIDPLTWGHTLAVSPDGSQFIYSTSEGLYLRFEDDLEARLIAGTDKDDPQSPFFSPDGKWVGYWSQAENQLKKIAIGGGAPVALCNVTWLFGAIWNPDNTLVYSDVREGIKSVSANGGNPEMLVKGLTAGPQLLPDGESILFTDVLTPAPYRIMVRSLKSEEQKVLFAGYAVKYLPTGHLVYWLQNNLYVVPFDLDTLEATDGPVPIIEGARYFAAISDSGTLVYIPGPQITGTDEARRTLVWVDRAGKEETLSAEPDAYYYPKISPDGSKIALTIRDGENQDIWIWDTVRETMTRLTFYEGQDIQSIWTHDGNRIVFRSARDEGGIYWKAADGTGEVEFLGSAPDRMLLPWSWSSDGNTLVMSEVGSVTEIEIGMLSMEGDRAHKRLLQEDYIEMQPKISPAGRWMAYTSFESGQSEIYVRPFPDVDEGKWQVSKDGGLTPLWSPDGKELFYRGPDGIMAVSVDSEPTFKLGKSKFLFGDIYVGLAGGGMEGHPWDIHPDGKRFLMMKEPETTADESTAETPRKIIIVMNWFEELKQRVPVD
jgi:serine/threonine protein kinase/Tol biopolymer transport system component